MLKHIQHLCYSCIHVTRLSSMFLVLWFTMSNMNVLFNFWIYLKHHFSQAIILCFTCVTMCFMDSSFAMWIKNQSIFFCNYTLCGSCEKAKEELQQLVRLKTANRGLKKRYWNDTELWNDSGVILRLTSAMQFDTPVAHSFTNTDTHTHTHG